MSSQVSQGYPALAPVSPCPKRSCWSQPLKEPLWGQTAGSLNCIFTHKLFLVPCWFVENCLTDTCCSYLHCWVSFPYHKDLFTSASAVSPSGLIFIILFGVCYVSELVYFLLLLNLFLVLHTSLLTKNNVIKPYFLFSCRISQALLFIFKLSAIFSLNYIFFILKHLF